MSKLSGFFSSLIFFSLTCIFLDLFCVKAEQLNIEQFGQDNSSVSDRQIEFSLLAKSEGKENKLIISFLDDKTKNNIQPPVAVYLEYDQSKKAQQVQFAQAQQVQFAQAQQVQAQLYLSHLTVQEGKKINLIVRLKIKEGWHIYWRNPGDSGLPLTIEFPNNLDFIKDDIKFPIPEVIDIQPLVDYGHKGIVNYSLDFVPYKYSVENNALLSIKARWLVCKEVCIPQEKLFSMPLTISDIEKVNPLYNPYRDSFIKQDNNINRKSVVGEVTTYRDYWIIKITDLSKDMLGGVKTVGTKIVPSVVKIKGLRYYPFNNDMITNNRQQNWFVIDGALYGVIVKYQDSLGLNKNNSVAIISDGLLVFKNSKDNILSLKVKQRENQQLAKQTIAQIISVNKNSQLNIPQEVKDSITKTISKNLKEGQNEANYPIIIILLFALIGGFILNFMPCVFPVIFLKLSALLKNNNKQDEDKHYGIVSALGYFIGVMIPMQIIATFVLLLSQTGEYVGFGSYLQFPMVIYLLMSIFIMLIMQIMGVFYLPNIFVNLKLPNFINKILAFAFIKYIASGVLTFLVSTPCIGPLLSIPLIFAFAFPSYFIYVIFFFITLGLSLPMMMLFIFKDKAKLLINFIPKPDVWMAKLQQFFIFPMLLTVMWLLWILVKLTVVDRLFFIALGLVAFVFALWLFSIIIFKFKWKFIRMIFLSLAIIVWLVIGLNLVKKQEITFVKYNAQTLQTARDNNQIVFVNVTADWCITCKYNEYRLFSSDKFKDFISKNNVLYMKADYTRYDNLIADYLKSFSAPGVPLYILYPKDFSGSIKLSQIITMEEFNKAIEK